MNKHNISVNQWMGIFVLLSIPFVNMILILVWAFSDNSTLKNFARGAIKLTFIIVGVFLAVFIGLGGKLPDIPSSEKPFFLSTEFPLESERSNLEKKIKFDKLIFRENMGITTISGEVTNSTNNNHGFSFIITFFDENKNIIGTATGYIENIEPNQTKTFETITMDNVKSAKGYRANIDSVLH